MKKTVALLLGVWAGMLPALAQAHQDYSFTRSATAGLFEDTYDYFSYSPAYLPGFKKNSLWTQFSNMNNQSEQVFTGAGTPSYFLAGQMDAGVGRVGVALDWKTETFAWDTDVFAYGTVNGFGENTYITYEDKDSDGIIDSRQEQYGKSAAGESVQNGDVQVSYGLGNIAGLDLGLGLRVDYWLDQYTYDPWSYYGSDYQSFEYVARERHTDLLTGQDTYLMDNSGGGQLNLGSSTWRMILSARTQDAFGMLPNLDMVVNVEPYFLNQFNSFKQDVSLSTDYSPAEPNVYSDSTQTYTLRGAEIGSGYIPHAGFGTRVKVRGEYPVLSWLRMTGWLGTDLSSWAAKDATMDATNHKVTRTTAWVTGSGMDGFYTRTEEETNYDYFKREDKYSAAAFNARLRGVIPMKGWKLALGAGVSTSKSTTEELETSGIDHKEHVDMGRGLDNENYSVLRTRMTKTQTTTEVGMTDWEFPIAAMFEILKNLTFQVGAKHTISYRVDTRTMLVKERVNETFTTVRDNGQVVSTSVGDPSGEEASLKSEYSVNRYTQFSYGLTWLPFEDVQVDASAFGTLLDLSKYRLSLSLFF